MGVLALLGQHPVLATAIGVLFLYVVISSVSAAPLRLPDNLPWSGKDASLASHLSHGRTWLTEGYQKFSKQAQTFIFADIRGVKHIVLPNEKASWVFDHSDDRLSVAEAHYDQLVGDAAFTDPSVLKLLYHEHVIHRTLARKLKDIIPHIWDEVGSCFDDIWGTDTSEWKEVVVFESMTKMVARISNRMFVGLPLCRNEKFLGIMASFAQDVVNCLIMDQLIPKAIKSILWPLLSLPNHYHHWLSSKYTVPIIKQRISDMEEKERNPDAKIEIPEDYFTWHIRLAKAEGKVKEIDPDFISRAVLAIEFAALHTTTISGTGAFLDLISSNPKDGFIDGIREEAERIFREEGGFTTKQALNKMVRADSAIRESLRVLDLIPMVSRKVIAKEGVHNAEEGWTAPYGSWVSLNSLDRHHDPAIYPNPDTYDAFRFSRPREAYEASNPTEKHSSEYLKLQNTSMTSTSENFLTFGHGRHACPGRFFVQQELKMLLAYMLLNYEIEPLAERPKATYIGMNIIPPMKAKIRVRRKTSAVPPN